MTSQRQNELAALAIANAQALLEELDRSRTPETDLKIALRWLKQAREEGWRAALEEQKQRAKRRKRTDAKTLLEAAKERPVTPADLLREHLEQRDPVSKSWAPLIAPVLCHMQRRCALALEDVLDYIYAHEPVDVFEFNAWARERAQTGARRAIA